MRSDTRLRVERKLCLSHIRGRAGRVAAGFLWLFGRGLWLCLFAPACPAAPRLGVGCCAFFEFI